MIGVTEGYSVSVGIIGLSEIPGEVREGRRVKRQRFPREHKAFSQEIASSATVFIGTGTILRRKGNGALVKTWKCTVRNSKRKSGQPFAKFAKGRPPRKTSGH
jgi:hypothetical protein